MSDIVKLTTDEQILGAFPLIQQLRPHLTKEDYLAKVKRMQAQHGYALVAAIVDGEAKSAAGYRINESLAWGKYFYVDDLITDAGSRSNGYAKLLFDWLEAEAAANGCEQFHLDSGVQRHDAHRFYLNKRMDIVAYHFYKPLP
ncbi:GNAT superfamily N-acetyltransferase [Paenibacillus endophyticus]|uniref:GNAT superfamily N-acetyltransferase n=1 Tax=Paenibacillus endophyticus TaxID=1294268 RepID=A0A7W5GBD7_9BACL|nr:GNAT family N-acetyltransferase [Paenibacillus endophyticus]MBB3153248.1 GNAT superfamily N-acetyltransferase [Paenibacillus endophyticus]